MRLPEESEMVSMNMTFNHHTVYKKCITGYDLLDSTPTCLFPPTQHQQILFYSSDDPSDLPLPSSASVEPPLTPNL